MASFQWPTEYNANKSFDAMVGGDAEPKQRHVQIILNDRGISLMVSAAILTVSIPIEKVNRILCTFLNSGRAQVLRCRRKDKNKEWQFRNIEDQTYILRHTKVRPSTANNRCLCLYLN